MTSTWFYVWYLKALWNREYGNFDMVGSFVDRNNIIMGVVSVCPKHVYTYVKKSLPYSTSQFYETKNMSDFFKIFKYVPVQYSTVMFIVTVQKDIFV